MPYLCESKTSAGPCQHVVSSPGVLCWQHDGKRLVVDLDVSPDRKKEIWKSGECAFIISEDGATLQCLEHDTENWQVAVAMGAERPCDKTRATFKEALLTNREGGLPQEVRTLANLARLRIPASMFRGGRLFEQYFDPKRRPLEVSDELLRKWWVSWPSASTGKAIVWLEERGETPAPWAALNLSPIRIKALIRARVTPALLWQHAENIRVTAPGAYYSLERNFTIGIPAHDLAKFTEKVPPERSKGEWGKWLAGEGAWIRDRCVELIKSAMAGMMDEIGKK